MGSFYFNDYVINKTNLIHNLELTKSKLNSDVKICAVVKANAYGVGLEEVVGVLKGLVDAYAVANIEEGIRVRRLDKMTPIIVLGCVNFDQIRLVEKYFLSPTISTISEARKLSSEVKKPITVEFGLNTGMNRIGFNKKFDILSAISILNKNRKIAISGVYSHLATKQNNVKFMYRQKHKFDHLLSVFDGIKITRHLSNSSASWADNKFNYDMVRIGFYMYGMGDDVKEMKRVVEIYSKIVHISKIKAGDSVGYDCTFKVKRDSVVAVLPIGYFDGVSRRLSNKGRVIINGEYAPIVGRICMDMMMVDITDIENVEVGTRVVVIGRNKDKEITIGEHANIVGTSEYEILSRFNNSRMNKIIKQ